jgi:23S rRNA (cytosine1962-C5)-methyltransferase
MAVPAVTLRKKLARAIRQGHPWVYRDALEIPAGLEDGQLVVVVERDGRRLATGFWDNAGPIAVRIVDLQPVRDPAGLIAQRLQEALGKRLARFDLNHTNAFRWVHGEGDHLPGIHVDVYDHVAVVRTDGAGARAFYGDLGSTLKSCASPLRIDAVMDRQERPGDVAPIQVVENDIRFWVDLGQGQKGGLFLDQRENRVAVAARAAGKRVLNLFGYTGAFSLYAAKAGARQTDTVDVARPAIEAARRNFELNGLPLADAGLHAVDAFDFLEAAAQRRERWDIVISDPPSFAPSRHALPNARRAYLRLHRLAASVVASGGLLCAASCSSHFARKEFVASVQEGVARAGRRFAVESVTGPGFDHPSLPIFPEGDYLKFVVGRVES